MTGSTATPVPAPELIPRETLDGMYRRELADLYVAAQGDKVFETHQLVEKYFAATSSEDRKAIAKWITSIGLDPNIVGRITRLHMDWPALDTGVYYINDKIGPNQVHYFLGVPKAYDRTQAWPLVIKLPNASAFVTQPPPDADQVVQMYSSWITDELTQHPDALVLMPLLNLDEAYGPSYAGMNSVMQAMHHATGRVNIDPARVYMVGHSMSAHAVWNLALHEPTYFAAINPLAGSASADWQRMRAMNLRNVLSVVWHDADDQVIKVARARELVRVLANFKCDVDYEETKNVGHVPNDTIVQRGYEKIRARTRDLYPKKVSLRSNRPDTLFNRSDWVQVYQMLRPGADRKLFFRHGSGHMTITENAYTIEADRAGPTKMDVKTENVESMRFYFNDRMLDFKQPYTITVNGKTRFEGIIKPSVEEMLKDQVFMGRGWRYFTGVVDIDFGEIVPALTPKTRPTTKPLVPPAPK